MTGKIRAEIKVNSTSICPISQFTEANDLSTQWITKTTTTNNDEVTEEFLVPTATTNNHQEMDEVFRYGDSTAYRFTRPSDKGCPCDVIESHHQALIDVRCTPSSIHASFHCDDLDALKETLSDLDENGYDVSVQSLLHTSHEGEAITREVIDLGDLTDRQMEVLRTAHEMGYFEHPRRNNASEIAEHMDITTPTFTEHLSKAQEKIMRTLVDQ